MFEILCACGAYGREANKEDWESGKDFKVIDGPYFSIRDIEKLKESGYREITFYGGKFVHAPKFTIFLT